MKDRLGMIILGVFFASATIYQLFIANNLTTVEETLLDAPLLALDEPKVVCIEEEPTVVEAVTKKQYSISEKGKAFIKKHEKCVLKAYNDPDPKRRSIGWGHQIRPNENYEQITHAKADELFDKDIVWVNDAINRLLSETDGRFEYSQGFIDGLGSLIYNCGERGVSLTQFYDRLKRCRYDRGGIGNVNKNDFYYAVAAVKTARISARGHIERRYNEHKMMLN